MTRHWHSLCLRWGYPVPYLTTKRGHRQSACAPPDTLCGSERSANARWVQRQPDTLKHPLSVAGKEHTMKQPIVRIIIIGIIINLVLLAVAYKDADAAPIKGLPCPEWHDALRNAGLPVRVFAPIMWRESRCQPKAIGWNYKQGKSHRDCKLSPARTYRKCSAVRSYDIGLLQVNSTWFSVTKAICKSSDILILQKPSCNIAVAAYLYANGGSSHWRATSNASISNK